MKFLFQYRTPDNVIHEGAIDSPDREAAFAELKAKGIRPGKLWEAPGLANKVLGHGKRWIAIGVLAAIAAVFAALLLLTHREVKTLEGELSATQSDTSPRHQIYGDPAIMEKFERGDFGTAFAQCGGEGAPAPSKVGPAPSKGVSAPSKGNEVLAWFAQPGKIMAPKETFPRRCTPEIENALGEATSSSLLNKDAKNSNRSDGDVASPSTHITICAQDSREMRELKQIVNGMKDELAAYLANGNGTVKSYYRRLVERTTQEIQIYDRTKRELENEKDPAIWEQKNEALRRLGLRTIPNPKEVE